MSTALRLAAAQVNRQAVLQPRLALPAGRTISLEEGRRLAKLVDAEEGRLASAMPELVEKQQAQESTVVLEENVSRRILLLRQKQNKAANVKAAVAHGKRQRQKSRVTASDAEAVQKVAGRLLHKSEGNSATLRHRRERAASRKDAKKTTKTSRSH